LGERGPDRGPGTLARGALSAFRDWRAAIGAGSAPRAMRRASRKAQVIGSIPIGGSAQEVNSLVCSFFVDRLGRSRMRPPTRCPQDMHVTLADDGLVLADKHPNPCWLGHATKLRGPASGQ